jgi:hypothetical protein
MARTAVTCPGASRPAPRGAGPGCRAPGVCRCRRRPSRCPTGGRSSPRYGRGPGTSGTRRTARTSHALPTRRWQHPGRPGRDPARCSRGRRLAIGEAVLVGHARPPVAVIVAARRIRVGGRLRRGGLTVDLHPGRLRRPGSLALAAPGGSGPPAEAALHAAHVGQRVGVRLAARPAFRWPSARSWSARGAGRGSRRHGSAGCCRTSRSARTSPARS